ncbi:hypothetical protein N0V84_002872 [Fusarium piperis]|uniref:Protein kinase domain-containing protein n=1 Tax=Fusarium piperis TaxID=1435070 RepID=A0A9W8WIK8_9HYPO|nr:hypothetical protein N0V84_002872 [Fusarium piperis]
MEYYLRYIEASDDDNCTCQIRCAARCESRKHVRHLLECALPPLDENSNTPFADYEGRRDKMFFSRKKIQAYFGNSTVINNLLGCRCHPCKQARERTSALDEEERPGIIESSQDGKILFALMIYLKKFHFVYAWFASSYRETDLSHAIFQLHRHGTFNSFMASEKERRLFKEACDQALEMLNPVQLSFSVSEAPREYADSQRFPFHAVDRISGGNFGTLKKFEIVEEYRDPSLEPVFAMKSVKIPDRDRLALAEQEMLRMVSNIDNPAAENIVTLLTCYTWRNEMHFVFPYIETDLYRLLRQEPVNDASPWFNNQALPENSLWKEMVGIASALSVIHTGLRNPFKRVHGGGRVFACHFDLKPANILVTADGKLKIGDFGRSHIQIVDPQGVLEIEYRGGDPKYAAPESQNEMQQINEGHGPHLDGGAPALKYDVWSLACIMTEVLIYLLNRQTPGETPADNPLLRFDRSLAQAEFNGRFFDQQGVKESVTTTIEAFQERFSTDSPASQYMSKIVDLLSGMFRYHNHERISSQEVVVQLHDAETAYKDSRDTDKLAFEVRQHSAPADDDFREIGWVPALQGDGNREPVSFDKM